MINLLFFIYKNCAMNALFFLIYSKMAGFTPLVLYRGLCHE